MRTPAATMQSRSTQLRADLGAVEDDRALDRRALPHRDALAEHDERADVRARRDRAAAVDERRRHDAPVGLHAVAHGQVAGPEAIGHGRRDVALEDVEGALQVALGRPDVEPVGVGGEAEEPLADELRPDLALDRDVAVGRDEVEHRALEHVGAGRDELRVDLVGAGLLDELLDRLVVVQAHEAVGGGVVDRHERERADRARVASCCASWAVRSMSVSTSPLSIRKRSSRRSSAYLSAPAVPRGSGSSTKRSRSPYCEPSPSTLRTAVARKPHDMTTSSTPWRASHSSM